LENDRLTKELNSKKNLEYEIEKLRKELIYERSEKERLKMEKEVQEKLTRKLNEKISGFKLKLKDKGSDKDDFPGSEKSADYYRDLSNKRLKESMQLAEQLICLRTDLERKSVELLKFQKQNSSYYSEPMIGFDKTPVNDLGNGLKKSSVSTINYNKVQELPPEPQTHRPKPYPLMNEMKSAGPLTPKTSKRSTSAYTSRPNSSRTHKLQGPNVPYQTCYHPHK